MDSVSQAIWGSAVILALALIVAANILSVRYQIAGDARQIYRLDRLTGAVTLCMVDEDEWPDKGASGVATRCDVPQK